MRGNISNNYRQKLRKNYFPFAKGMSGEIFKSGANYQLNMDNTQGVLQKVKQISESAEISGFTVVNYLSEHELTNGDSQTLVFGLLSSNLKLRVIEADGTITTPSAGAGDLTFTGTISARQVGLETIITHSGGQHNWDGTKLVAKDSVINGAITAVQDFNSTVAGTVLITSIEHGLFTGDEITISGTTDYNGTFIITVTSINDFYITETYTSTQTGTWFHTLVYDIVSSARDGSRVGFITADGKAQFSDADPINGFTGSSGANANGDYNCGIPVAKAIIEGGTGVVIFGKHGAEAHWVQPNNASDSVSSRTKIESFSYYGRGADSDNMVTSAGDSVIFMNEEGIFEMNPFSGKSTNLIKGGKIERYWNEQVNSASGFVAYDSENDLIIAQVALDSPQNNVLICFNRKEAYQPFIINNHFLNAIGVVKGTLLGGSNKNGKVFELFKSYKLVDGTTNKSKYITEYDGLGEVAEEKTLYSITAVLGVSPNANIQVRAYFDNNNTPIIEKRYEPSDLTTQNGEAVYGEYVFALGLSDLVAERIINGERVKASSRFKTIAIEILEESNANFEIYDIILEYKRSGRLSKTISLKNNLF